MAAGAAGQAAAASAATTSMAVAAASQPSVPRVIQQVVASPDDDAAVIDAGGNAKRKREVSSSIQQRRRSRHSRKNMPLTHMCKAVRTVAEKLFFFKLYWQHTRGSKTDWQGMAMEWNLHILDLLEDPKKSTVPLFFKHASQLQQFAKSVASKLDTHHSERLVSLTQGKNAAAAAASTATTATATPSAAMLNQATATAPVPMSSQPAATATAAVTPAAAMPDYATAPQATVESQAAAAEAAAAAATTPAAAMSSRATADVNEPAQMSVAPDAERWLQIKRASVANGILLCSHRQPIMKLLTTKQGSRYFGKWFIRCRDRSVSLLVFMVCYKRTVCTYIMI